MKRSLVPEALTLLLILIMSLPIVWLWYNSFRLPIDIVSTPLGGQLSSYNYGEILAGPRAVWPYLRNSTAIVGGATLICIMVGSLAGYSLSRLGWSPAITGVILGIVLFIQLIPPIGLAPSFYSVLSSVGLTDTLTGLILINTVLNVPFAVLLMKIYFDGLPSELREAALVDGASETTAFARVLLPLARPGMLTVALFVGVLAWNEFLMGVSLTSSLDAQPLTVFIAGHLQEHNVRYGELSAGAAVASVPAVLVAALAQKYIVSGITRGAVKA